jgi:hypothetical protein
LARCSRLVVTEERSPGGGGGAAACMTAAQPTQVGIGARTAGRTRRFPGFSVGRPSRPTDEAGSTPHSGGLAAPGATVPTPPLHLATAPSRALCEASAALHRLSLQQPPPSSSLSPTPESPPGVLPLTPVSGGESSVSTPRERHRGPSPLGRSVVTALEAQLEEAMERRGERASAKGVLRPRDEEREEEVVKEERLMMVVDQEPSFAPGSAAAWRLYGTEDQEDDAGGPPSPTLFAPSSHPGPRRRLSITVPSPAGTPCSTLASGVPCLSCGHCVAPVALLRHSSACSRLGELVSRHPGVDAALTLLGDAGEDALVGGSGDTCDAAALPATAGDADDLEDLVAACRAAASLQPDGSEVPAERCEVGDLSIAAGRQVFKFLFCLLNCLSCTISGALFSE